jgi:2-phosphoglycerate kinase
VAYPQLIIVGGAPGVGKTTLGTALAQRLGYSSFSMDDLYVASKAVTTPASHPALHCMRKRPSADYFTFTDPDQLIADAEAQHASLLPAIESVIRYRVANGPPAVIDGWFVTPVDIETLNLQVVRGIWIVAPKEVLIARERAFTKFYAPSPDPDRMLRNFIARSMWHNLRVMEQAAKLRVPVLEQDGTHSPQALCDTALYLLGAM